MKYKFEQLLNRSYEAVKNRGLITSKTNEINFLIKMKEELAEFENAVLFEPEENKTEEAMDLATVCFMYLINKGLNPIDEFEKVVIKNEKRANILITKLNDNEQHNN